MKPYVRGGSSLYVKTGQETRDDDALDDTLDTHRRIALSCACREFD